MNRIRRDEQGVAMVMTMTVIFVAAALVAVVLLQGTNTERGSGRTANRTEALQVADAGVEHAIATLQSTDGAVPTSAIAGTTAGGTYEATVTYLGRNRYQIDSIGTVGEKQGLRSQRHVRVVMAPPKSFQFALFSLTDIDTKNLDVVEGDVWANGSVTVDQNNVVNGSVTAATGFLTMRNGSIINGDVITGGYNGSNVAADVRTVNGNVTAASTSPGCVDDSAKLKYRIVNGTISGTATTWGNSVGSSAGTKVTGVCTAAPATKPLPTFTYNPLNYDPAPMEFSSPSEFNTYLQANKSNFSGTYYITGGGQYDPVDITGMVITGDTTIVATDAPITADNGSAFVTSGNQNDKVLVLVSYYQPPSGAACTDSGGNPGDCAIGIKNDFSLADNTATLVYAPNGPVAFKNSATFWGAVYANNIVMKNSQTTVYDARVEQIVGFGPVTLERESWIEVSG
jgi:hypothetical protein